jgi:hypothetical protein
MRIEKNKMNVSIPKRVKLRALPRTRWRRADALREGIRGKM